MPRLFNPQRMESTIFIGDEWETRNDVIQSFAPLFENQPNVVQMMLDYYSMWKGIELLFCVYVFEGLNANAFVLFKHQSGKLFEVNAAHCSCYGLEGQFIPDETTITALKYRIENGKLGRDFYRKNIFAEELTAFLNLIA
jgi:hypothetical protein